MFDVIVLATVCVLVIIFILKFWQYNRVYNIKNKYVFNSRIKIKDAFQLSTIKESRDIAYVMVKLSNKMEMSENIRVIRDCYKKINNMYIQVLHIEHILN